MGNVAVAYCIHDDGAYFAASIRSFKSAGPVVVFLSRVSWNKDEGDWQECERIAKAEGAKVILGDWPTEAEHRSVALAWLRDKGHAHVLIPDGDEVIEPKLLKALLDIAEKELAERVRVFMDTYWKSPEYVIRPREHLAPLILLDVRCTTHDYIREYEGGRLLVLEPHYGVLHHLSYCGEERVNRKIATWSHKHEIVEGWFHGVWKAWDANRQMRNLHPTRPEAYGVAERIPIPECLSSVGIVSDERPPIKPPAKLPKASVVIPLYGGEEDIAGCLSSLAAVVDLIDEVVVVDDASPDDAKKVAKAQLKTLTKLGAKTHLIELKENVGFPAACNEGYRHTTNPTVIFLNSDTVVTRTGVIRLLESLDSSGTIGAVGPYTSYSAGYQQTIPTFSDLTGLDLFADDFARRPAQDLEVDFLTGFCLAVRRSVLEEVGLFDERFGIGMFEDNDLCYRIRRAGYRLVVASRSYIHHYGSNSLTRAKDEFEAIAKRAATGRLLHENSQLFRDKWRKDLECGYVNGLPGMIGDRIAFDERRKPENLVQEAERLALQADISLCMIVKDEERVLRDCLESAKPFFREIIVIDTGSTDGTKKIAKDMGAIVHDFPWQDSFSLARNESMKYANGKWIFWLDADDTLPLETGMALLRAAITAPSEIKGFIVPVQFVGDMAAGTRVDHVKLFRNIKGLTWVGHIHENILPSLSQHHSGLLDRIEGVVLHSGYDNTPEGQERKFIRDRKLLFLDYLDDPRHPFFLFNLGMTQHFRGKHKEAILWLRKCLRYAQGATFLKKAYVLMATSLDLLGRQYEAIRLLEVVAGYAPADIPGSPFLPDGFLKGIPPEITKNNPEMFYNLGQMFLRTNRPHDAKRAFKEALDADSKLSFNSFDSGILGWKSYLRLFDAEKALSNHGEALGWLQKAVKESGRPDLMFVLFEFACDIRHKTVAEEMLEKVRALEGPSVSWTSMLVRHSQVFHPWADVIETLERAVASFPNVAGPRLALTQMLANQNRFQEAVPHWRALATMGNPEGAWCLNVEATRRGALDEALHWTELCLKLDPDSSQAKEQLEKLSNSLRTPC